MTVGGVDAVGLGYSGLLAAAVVTATVTAWSGLDHRDRPGGGAFVTLTAAVAVWAGCELAGLYVDSLQSAMLVQRVSYLVISLTPVAWLVLALRHAGWGPHPGRRTVAALLLVPAVTLTVSLTNGSHELLWSVEGLDRVHGLTVLEASYGPWFWVHTGYSYLLIAVGSLAFLRWALFANEAYRMQTWAVLAALAFPWTANAAYVAGVSPSAVDVTPAFFTGSCALLLVGLYRYRLLEVTPVARDRVVEEMREGVAVIDEHDRVVDLNPAARAMLGHADPVGAHVSEVFAPEVLERFGDVVEGGGVQRVARPDGARHYRIRISPLSERSEGARIAIFHDVTEREARRERLAHETAQLEARTAELRRQNERLDRFASIVSHDLRNPLNVAVGWTDVLAERGGDPEAIDRVRTAHDRIGEIVEDSLQIARSAAEPDTEPVDLARLAREATAVVGGPVVVEVETDLTVRADRDRLLRAFENMFRNSAEHGRAPDDDPVTVTVGDLPDGVIAADADGVSEWDTEGERTAADGSGNGPTRANEDESPWAPEPVGFYVTDDGRGFPPDEGGELFSYGHSLDGGTGLGLAIVADVAAAHGWSVRAETGRDGGARLEFRGVTPA